MEIKSYKVGRRDFLTGIFFLAAVVLQAGCQTPKPMKPLLIAGQVEKYALGEYEYDEGGHAYLFDIVIFKIDSPVEHSGRTLRIAIPSDGSYAVKVFGRDEAQLNLLKTMRTRGESWEFGVSRNFWEYLLKSEREGGALQVIYGNQLEGLKRIERHQ